MPPLPRNSREKECTFALWPAIWIKLRETADRLAEAANISVHVVSADLRDPAAPQQAIAEVVAQLGRLDLLVNNAGATKRADFFSLTEEDWQDGFALKFHGYVRMTRSAWPHLCQTQGSIVNIVGIGSRAGSAEFTIGGSVNVALLNFTKAMADIGVTQAVRVNAINPGLIQTDRFTRNIERVMRDHGLSRDDALMFLVSSHGTHGLVSRRKSVLWSPTSRQTEPASFRAPSSISMAEQLGHYRHRSL